LAALAAYVDALALDVLKEGALLWSIDVPEAEIVLVDGGHLSVLPLQAADATVEPQSELTAFPNKRCDVDHTAICRRA
jgi:hypothetical protein